MAKLLGVSDAASPTAGSADAMVGWSINAAAQAGRADEFGRMSETHVVGPFFVLGGSTSSCLVASEDGRQVGALREAKRAAFGAFLSLKPGSATERKTPAGSDLCNILFR